MSNILNTLLKSKVVAIIRGVHSKDIIKAVQALKDGGIQCVEVTFNQSSAEGYADTVKSLNLLHENFGSTLCIGAGTVLTTKTIDKAAAAGAQYIISPNVDEAVIKYTKDKGLVSLPGAFTPTEIMNAFLYGADIIKLFPAGILGSEYLKMVRAPLSHIPLMAVGGITPENIRSFIEAGAVGAGVGGKLADVQAIAAGNFEKLTQMARLYLSAISYENL